MSTPTVIEIAPRPEPVVHDPFIDDLPGTPALTLSPAGEAPTNGGASRTEARLIAAATA